MIGTAFFLFFLVVGDRTFFKRSVVFKKDNHCFLKKNKSFFKNVLIFYPCRKFHRKPHFVETLLMHTSYDRKA